LKRFQSWSHIPKVLRLLEHGDRGKLVLLGLLQLLISSLDLIALLTIGVLTSLGLSLISATAPPKSLNFILEFPPLNGHKLETVIVILAGCSALLLVTKTIISASLMRRIIGFLALREAQLSSFYMNSVLRLSPVIQQSWTPQYISGVAMTGVNCAVTITLAQVVNLLVEGFSILLLFTGISIVNLGVTLPTAIFFILMAYFSIRFLGARIKNMGKTTYILGITSAELIQNSIATAREIHVSNSQERLSSLFSDQRMKSYQATRARAFLSLIPKYISEIGLVIGAIFIASIQLLTKDAKSAIAGMVIFLALSSRLIPSLLKIQQSVLEIRAATSPTLNFLEEYNEIQFLLKADQEINNDLSQRLIQPSVDFSPEIILDSVSVSYPGATSPTLRSISLNIQPGEFVAIVGPSGAGKSTLVDLILGILAPDKGTISLSRMSPRAAISKWPNKIRYVPQDVAILAGSIKTNIVWPSIQNDDDDGRINELLQIVKLDTWVNSLPNTIDSHLSTSGNNLSGGQKQRIGIARSLYSSPELLILDESTSSLDASTEEMITDSILREMKNITRIVIAHRLSTVRDADMVIYIDNGEVRAIGTFEYIRQVIPEFDRNAATNGLL
jgi:ATP-binding cassette, subfamily B, bacterial PglK